MALTSKESLPKVSSINKLHFPDIIDNKIQTETFLHASRDVVRIIEKFGKLFAPVKNDMEGNIEKLNNKYSLDKEKHNTLQDMILLEKEIGGTSDATNALMWLRRGLYMILLFFEQIVEDHKAGKATEDLGAFIKEAYKQSLEPYHGWMIQQLFGLLSRMVPSRNQVLKTITDEDNIKDEILLRDIDIYLKTLRSNIDELHVFYQIYELEDHGKV